MHILHMEIPRLTVVFRNLNDPLDAASRGNNAAVCKTTLHCAKEFYGQTYYTAVWLVTTDPLFEVICKVTRALGFHKALSSDGLSPALFKCGRTEGARELQVSFSEVGILIRHWMAEWYTSDIALLNDYVQPIRYALDRLAIEVSGYGICCAPWKCNTFLQDWQEPVPIPAVYDDNK